MERAYQQCFSSKISSSLCSSNFRHCCTPEYTCHSEITISKPIRVDEIANVCLETPATPGAATHTVTRAARGIRIHQVPAVASYLAALDVDHSNTTIVQKLPVKIST